jgi:hypothetical protein
MFDPRWDDPRDRDEDPRDLEIHWVDLAQIRVDADPRDEDVRDRGADARDRDADPRDRDPRDVFLYALDLPRGDERELVIDGDARYELNGEDARWLATVGAFRVVPERDVLETRETDADAREFDLEYLRDEGLIRFVALDGDERGVTLTDAGEHLLDSHRLEHDDDRDQTFYADVSRERELTHDAELYHAFAEADARLRDEGADVHRIVLDQELKREYQEWLQEHNRGRADSDGRPDRDAREIEQWAREHNLPFFDDAVHFPDFRIEYEVNGYDRHVDIEVVTEHYRGAHAAAVARSGFRCVRAGGSGRGRGGRPFDPRVAEDVL